MRELTEQERELLRRREEGFQAFFEESRPVLVDFIQRLSLPEPHMVLRNADRYLPAVDEWMARQTITDEDRTWILTRIMYFIGELINQRHSGAWFVDAEPGSRFFGQYVVGQFARATVGARVSPGDVAGWFVNQPVGRSLIGVVNRIEEDLLNHSSASVK